MSTLASFWTIFIQTLSFNELAFKSIVTLPMLAVLMVLMAGVAEAIGQSVLLFINRVKPKRFVLSLLINALLFVFTYFFWVFSVSLVARFVFHVEPPPASIARVLGISYAPRMFSFLEFLPVIGVPISSSLAIWSFLLVLFGLSVALSLSAGQALICAILGALVLLVLRRTIGRPLLALARFMRHKVAGVELVNPKLIEQNAESNWVAQNTSGETV